MKKPILFIVILILLWQSIYFIFPNKIYLLPSPVEVIIAFIDVLISGEIFIHILTSLQRVLVGFFIASFVGIILAIFLGYYRKISDYIKPLIEIIRPIPPIAWIPIAILLFGLGNISSYFIVFLGAFFPVFTNTYFGVISLPKIYKNVADSFEISEHIFIKKILFYFSLPYILAGLKIGIGMAWMSVIAAELIGAQSGLGYFIQINRLLLRTDNILVGMILIGIVGFILSKLISLIEKILMPWRKE